MSPRLEGPATKKSALPPFWEKRQAWLMGPAGFWRSCFGCGEPRPYTVIHGHPFCRSCENSGAPERELRALEAGLMGTRCSNCGLAPVDCRALRCAGSSAGDVGATARGNAA